MSKEPSPSSRLAGGWPADPATERLEQMQERGRNLGIQGPAYGLRSFVRFKSCRGSVADEHGPMGRVLAESSHGLAEVIATNREEADGYSLEMQVPSKPQNRKIAYCRGLNNCQRDGP